MLLHSRFGLETCARSCAAQLQMSLARGLILELSRVDRINMLMMVSRQQSSTEPTVRIISSLANPAWMAIFVHLRSSTVITRILRLGDFMDAWSSCRLVCREFLVAVDSTWIEVCRLFVVQRCRRVTCAGSAYGRGGSDA